MKTRTIPVGMGTMAAAGNVWKKKALDNAAICFFQLMAATAQTAEARAIYLSFIEKERNSMAEQKNLIGSMPRPSQIIPE